jgi:hypothetical protein
MSIVILLISTKIINYRKIHKSVNYHNLMPYQTINSCSQKPSLLCVLSIGVYLILIVLHLIYILPAITCGLITYVPILYVLLGLHFALIIAILYDYIWILVHDPVDTVVYDPQLIDKIDP